MSEKKDGVDEIESRGRRDFLAKAGRFAVATPAAVTVLLSTSMDADAGSIMKSGGQQPYKKGRKKYLWKIKRFKKQHYRKFWQILSRF